MRDPKWIHDEVIRRRRSGEEPLILTPEERTYFHGDPDWNDDGYEHLLNVLVHRWNNDLPMSKHDRKLCMELAKEFGLKLNRTKK